MTTNNLGEPTIGLPSEQNTAPPTQNNDDADNTPEVTMVDPITGGDIVVTPEVATVETVGQEPVEVPEAVTVDTEAAEAAREAELQSAIDFSERVESGEFERIAAQQGAPQMPDFGETYKASVLDIKAKYALLQQIKDAEKSYRQAGIEIPPEVQKQIDDAKLRVYGEASPFIDLNTGAIDTVTALKAGLNPDALRAVGVTDDTLNKTYAYINIQDLYNGDVYKAIEAGDIELVRTLYGGEATLDFQIALADKRQADIELAKWEAEVLPTLPEEYQIAYKEQNAAKLAELETQYQLTQEEFDSWINSAEAPPELREAYLAGGIDGYNKALAEYESGQMAELRVFEEWINTEANEYLRNAYRSGGIESYNKAVSEQDSIMQQIQDYRVPAKGQFYQPLGAPPALSDNYNLLDAIRAGYDISKLYKVFPKEVVDTAVKTNDAINKLESAGGSPAWALGMGKINKEELELAIGEESNRYISEFEAFERANAMLKGTDYEVVKPKSDNWGDVFEAAMKNNKVFNTLVTLQYSVAAGTEFVGAGVANYSKMAQTFANTIPVSPPARVLIKIPLGLASGAAESVAGGLSMLTFVTGIPTNLTDAQYFSRFKNNVARGFVDIGKRALVDPAWGAGEVAGLTLGAGGVLRLARTLATKLSPYYIPNTAMRFTFSSGKLPMKWGEIGNAIKSGKITEVQVANAIARVTNRAMANPTARATAQIGRTNIRIYIEPTPASAAMGSALWRATPDKKPYTALEKVVDVQGKEPAEFYSLQAAPRFAMSSASGVAATSPALIMVYTKAGKLTSYPASIQYANSLARMRQLGFEYLGSGKAKPGAYAPIKTYGIGFELEAMLPNGMKIYRVTNFRSRILGAGAGEFVTTVKGWVLPIYRFAEKGATIPKVGIAELAALRITSLVHGIRAMLGKKGFGSEAGYADIRTMTKQLEMIGRAAMGNLKGSAANRAYNNAVNNGMRAIIANICRDASPKLLEQAWRTRADVFEREYLYTLWRESARMTDYRVNPDAYRPDSSYTTVRLEPDNRLIEYRAEELNREMNRLANTRDISIREVPRADRTDTLLREMTRPPERIEPPSRIPSERPPDRIEPPYERPFERPPDRRPPDSVEPPTSVIAVSDSGSAEDKEDNLGAIVWRMGSMKINSAIRPVWKILKPPYTQLKPHTVFTKPIGARDGITPYNTIQVIGDSRRVPDKVAVDLGISDVFITEKGTKIDFRGKGEETNVGTTLEENTVGLTILGEDEFGDLPASYNNIPVKRSKSTKRNKNRASNVYMTTLKGLRK